MFPTQSVLFVAIILINFCLSQDPVSSPGCSTAPPFPAGSTNQVIFQNPRLYQIHIPILYDSNIAHPLIIGLPGYGTTASYLMNNFGLPSQSDEYNYIAVVAEGSKHNGNTRSWNDETCTAATDGPPRIDTCTEQANGKSYRIPSNCDDNSFNCNWCNCNVDDIGLINNLLNQLESIYCIDISREYVLGYSNGGMMAHSLACSLNNRFAAVATFHGRRHEPLPCSPIPNTPKIPIVHVCGTTDGVIPCHVVESNDHWLYRTVDDAANDFRVFNGCQDTINVIATISDGIRSWQCNGYDTGCTDDAWSIYCEWNGAHGYPIDNNDNFGLRAVYESFFQRYTRSATPFPTSSPNTAIPTKSPITAIPTEACKPKNQPCIDNNECCSGRCKRNGRCR